MKIKLLIIYVLFFSFSYMTSNQREYGIDDPFTTLPAQIDNNSMQSFVVGLCIGYCYGQVTGNFFKLYKHKLDLMPRIILAYVKTYFIINTVNQVSTICKTRKIVHDEEAMRAGALLSEFFTFLECSHS